VADVDPRQYIGVPWRHQGRNPAVGLDCVGFAALHLANHGIQVQDRADYGRDPDGSLWAELCRCMGDPVAQGRGCASKGQPGDVVILEYSPKVPRHVGVLGWAYDALSLVHCDSRHKKVVEHPINAQWAKRIIGVWRLP